ncbi:MAG: hypothetical protein IKF38_02140, partial [Clostridia bacterium]|nr:hypothetical protein [Clostridia bacterium]
MKEQMKSKNRLKQTKGICTRHNPSVIGKASTAGITLIALVITVIVLLILAGVSISAITGNESAMEKAKQAKTANEKADELDTLKLAVVEAVSRGLTGTVTQENLQAALNGVSGFSMTSNGDGTFTVTGSKGEYTVTENGSVTRKNGLTLNTRSLSVTEGSTGTITATLS